MPEKQAIRRRMHSDELDSSKFCAARPLPCAIQARSRLRVRAASRAREYRLRGEDQGVHSQIGCWGLSVTFVVRSAPITGGNTDIARGRKRANSRSHAIIQLVATAEHLAAMVIPAARLAAILLQIARGLPPA